MWEKNLVCYSISTATTFLTEAYQETFKIQSGPLTCDSEKVLYLLKTYATEAMKNILTFWQDRLKTFHPIGLNENEEYLY